MGLTTVQGAANALPFAGKITNKCLRIKAGLSHPGPPVGVLRIVIRGLPAEPNVGRKVNSIKAESGRIKRTARRAMAFCFLERADIAYHTGSAALPLTFIAADTG